MSRAKEDPAWRLEQCRIQIDEIDVRITELLNERARIVEVIGRVKQEMDAKVYEPKREEQLGARPAG